jgi:hypothetical protein
MYLTRHPVTKLMTRDRIKGTPCRLRVNETGIPSVIFGPKRKELTI